MAAGLQLKNQLTSKDESVKLKFQTKWLQLPEDTRAYIKKNVSVQGGGIEVHRLTVDFPYRSLRPWD
jgi:hypothetical protein